MSSTCDTQQAKPATSRLSTRLRVQVQQQAAAGADKQQGDRAASQRVMAAHKRKQQVAAGRKPAASRSLTCINCRLVQRNLQGTTDAPAASD